MEAEYKLTFKHHFDAAHKLELDYDSSCKRLHGHRWEVIVEIEALKLDKNGMIIDFTEIKKVIGELDHRNLNEVLDFNPTAENIACHLQETIYWMLKDKEIDGTVRVTIFESPNASVTYG